MKKLNQIKTLLVASVFCLTGLMSELKSQSTDGEMTFTVRTVTANGNFSPKHILAIWVEDGDGFVLTRKLRADKRKEYLYTWVSNSGENTVDAITGATLSDHETHTITWDCKDVDGNLTPDGVYTVYVEFTDAHVQGPLHTVSFTKGPDVALSITPADATYFKDISLTFVPAAVTSVSPFEASGNSNVDALHFYPNPSKGMVFINLDDRSGIFTLKIFKLNGSLVSSKEIKAPGSFHVDMAEFESGSYLFQLDSEQQSAAQLIIKE